MAKDKDQPTPRKDDHVISEGPGDGYAQKITRESNDGRESAVKYFDAAGKELDVADNLPGMPDKADPKHTPDPKHGVEHKR